jgi:hypothetical protein
VAGAEAASANRRFASVRRCSIVMPDHGVVGVCSALRMPGGTKEFATSP